MSCSCSVTVWTKPEIVMLPEICPEK